MMPTEARPKKSSRSPAGTAAGDARRRRQPLEKALAAGAARDGEAARAQYSDLVGSDPTPSGALLEQLGLALRGTGAFEEASRVMGRAYRTFLEDSCMRGEVRACTALVGFRGIPGDRAGAAVWERRGWGHLEGMGPCVERGYHSLAWVGCDVHAPVGLVARPERAFGIAREFKDRDLEIRALGDKGLAMVCQGQVDEGFALLD